jgi:hypothetical protein
MDCPKCMYSTTNRDISWGQGKIKRTVRNGRMGLLMVIFRSYMVKLRVYPGWQDSDQVTFETSIFSLF